MFRVLTFFTIISCYSLVQCNSDNSTFYYFAYGSNLLAKRIHIQNPSAVYYSTAKLQNYRLDFNLLSDTWNGAAATIVEDVGEEVWGVLWTLDINQIANLDDQEAVDKGWYFPKNVTVTMPNGTEVMARTYQETVNPNKTRPGEDLPLERRPSNTYLEVIALGAIESRLPADYIGFIFSFPTNGQMGSKKIRNELGYPF